MNEDEMLERAYTLIGEEELTERQAEFLQNLIDLLETNKPVNEAQCRRLQKIYEKVFPE